MMGFITHCSKNVNALFYVAFATLFLLFSPVVSAQDDMLTIKSAELDLSGTTYQLNADFDIKFNEHIEEALRKGLALPFLLEFQLVAYRKYWFDDEIVTVSSDLTLSYHALSRQYLLQRGTAQQAFSTLLEALSEMAKVRGWRVFDKSLLDKDEQYKASMLIRLDASKLPKALQVDAGQSANWHLKSETFHWTPTFNMQ